MMAICMLTDTCTQKLKAGDGILAIVFDRLGRRYLLYRYKHLHQENSKTLQVQQKTEPRVRFFYARSKGWQNT